MIQKTFKCGCGLEFPNTGRLANHAVRSPSCTPEGRFWVKVDKSGGADACWPYTGSITSHGYGCVAWKGRVLGAHKIAYMITKGPVEAGMQIMHSCDNPPCCNPAHLSVGSRQDNADDRMRKGRSSGYKKGKLTVADVLEIRRLRGIERSGSLSKRFGVEQSHIINIWNRRIWRGV